MSKKRSDTQRLEDLYRARAKEVLSPFVVYDPGNNSGLDLEVALTEEDEEHKNVQPQSFDIQLKSSHNYGSKVTVAEDIETDDLRFWIQQPIPVVLVAWDDPLNIVPETATNRFQTEIWAGKPNVISFRKRGV